MEPGLAAKFPEIKTFAGQGIDDPYSTIRFDYNPYFGFHAQILSVKGDTYIDPYAKGDINFYSSYYTNDNKRNPSFICYSPDSLTPSPNISARTQATCRGTELYTYRLALACTGDTFNMYGNGDMVSVGSLSNQGSMYIAPGATFDPMRVDNYNLITLNGTLVVGTGTPGGPGYYQFASGTLGEHIDVSNFGVVVVGNGGTANLNGTLDIQLASGFNPAVGSSYDIITFAAGNLNGTFASVLNNIFNNGTEKWTVIYNNSGGYVELLAQSNNSTIPEPASMLLLGSGLLTIGYGARRRLKK